MATDEVSKPPLPSYSEMILGAIEALDEKAGSNKSAISKYIEAKYAEQLPEAHSSLLTAHLARMKESGEILMVKNNYMKPGPEATPKRGRGRPPKPKTPLPAGSVSPSPRPRGRPPKPKDPLAAAVAKAASGMPRQRGRPPKKARVGGGEDIPPTPPSVAAPAAPPGIKRGRGRPPKVKPPFVKGHSYDPSIVDWTQMKIQIKPGLTQTRPIGHSYNPRIVISEQSFAKTKPEFVTTDPNVKNSNNPKLVGLKQLVIDRTPELVRTNPMENHSSDPRIADLKRRDTGLKSETESTGPSEQQVYDPRIIDDAKHTKIQLRPEQMIIKPIGQHIYDPLVVSLKQTITDTKPELDMPKAKYQQPSDSRIVSVNQTLVQAKPESLRSELTEVRCQDPGIPLAEVPYVHYPVPTKYSRGRCACTPVRFYVIVSMQRSGSKWLESLLNSHANISSNGEIFIDRTRSANVSAITQTLDMVYNLDWRHSASKRRCTAAVGFKWMLNQGILENHEKVSKYFKQRGVSVIFLFRRNLLLRMVSALANVNGHSEVNGTHKAHVITHQEADILASYKPKLNAKLLVSKLKLATRKLAAAKEFFKSIRHMDIYYEDLVQNNTQKLTEVMDFLRVPQQRLSSDHVKIHTRPISEMVRNWNAVSRSLRGSPFASFLTSN